VKELVCIKVMIYTLSYKDDIDPDSAYEIVNEMRNEAIEQAEKEKSEKARNKETDRLKRKLRNRAENEVLNIGFRSARKLLKNLLK